MKNQTERNSRGFCIAILKKRPLIVEILWGSIYWGLLRNESFAHASNIAFSILSSLFPFIILLTGLAGYWGGDELARAAEQGTGGIFSVMPEGLSDILKPELKAVLGGSQTQVLTVGAILLVIIVTGFVEALRMGLNYAYRLQDTRHFLLRRLEGMLFLCISGAAVLLMGFSALVIPLSLATLYNNTSLIQNIPSEYLPTASLIIVLAAFLTLAHMLLPARSQGLKTVLPGVITTTTLCYLAGAIFSYYLSHFASYTRTYAGLAGAVALMLFFYIIGLLFLMGAELNYSIGSTKTRKNQAIPTKTKGDVS